MAVKTETQWLTDIESAKKRAQDIHLPLLLFFHSHHCGGCKRTLAETLPDPRVSDTIAQLAVPGLFEISEQPKLTDQYKVDWTPTFIIADENGTELYRWIGFLPPDEYLAQLHLGLGRAAFAQGKFDQAYDHFNTVLSDYEQSVYAPEARYWLGVSEYKNTNKNEALVKTNYDMAQQYPGNIWTEKASVWKE